GPAFGSEKSLADSDMLINYPENLSLFCSPKASFRDQIRATAPKFRAEGWSHEGAVNTLQGHFPGSRRVPPA
ncbi:MAG: hypothetical protein J07HR59_01629, partial [Halorubrum sp. J07HR59]